jgi:hypothetical protein
LASGLGSIVEGPYLSANGGTTILLKTDRGGGVYKVSGAILGSPCGADGLTGTLFYVTVTSGEGVTDSGAVAISEIAARDCGNQPMPAVIGSAAMVHVDRSPPTVAVTAPDGTETWWVGTVRDITWTATDNAGVASIDIDYSTDNGAAWTSVATGEANDGIFAWTVPNAPTALALVRVTAHDVNTNTSSDASDAAFTIAYPPVGAIADLSAAQVRTGNAPGTTTGVRLSWTATPSGATVEVWRQGFGHYPEYDDDGGETPAAPTAYPPGAGWALTPVAAPDSTDLTPERDFYYYVAYTRDVYGTWSPASNMTSGTLNYHLGDVSDGATAGTGNNAVFIEDISLLGAHYGVSLTPNDPLGYLDVGPTTNWWIDGCPSTDNRVEFEDLVMFGLNYERTGKLAGKPSPAAGDELVLRAPGRVRVGEEVEGRLLLSGSGRVRAFSIALGWDTRLLQPLPVEIDTLVESNGAILLQNGPDVLDLTVLGRTEGGFSGSGTLAVLRFRALANGVPALTIRSLKARGADNRPLEVPYRTEIGPGSPRSGNVVELLPPAPNPCRGATVIEYRLPEPDAIDLAIFAADGRSVCVLDRGPKPAGSYTVSWDGRDNRGRPVGSGGYYARLATSSRRYVRTLILVR